MLIDAHCHPAMTGITELLEVDCNRRSIAEIKDAIREWLQVEAEEEGVLSVEQELVTI